MNTTIKCIHCGKDIEISEAIKHAEETKIREELTKELSKKESIELADLKKQLDEQKKKGDEFREKELALLADKRKLEEKEKDFDLQLARKLDEEKKKIELEVGKKVEEEQHTKIIEKDKQLQDALKEIEEMRRKLQQGSQQTQGEAFELEFEELLQKEFPNDKILPVAKGTRGGDIIQEVWDSRGNYSGKILWELKNTKLWSEDWVLKLKSDQRSIKAEDAVLISEVLPKDITTAGFRNGIWVTKRTFVIGIASALRAKLIQLYYAKLSVEGKNEKMEIMYSYLAGTEFKHRVEAIVEAFSNMQQEIEKEKRYFANKWARDEKNIRQVIDQTYGMHGDIKGIAGEVIPQIKGLEALELESGDNS